MRPKWSWSGIVAFTLTFCVATAWGISLVLITLNPQDVTESDRSLLSVIGGVLAGAISTYIGASIHRILTQKEDNSPLE